MLRETSIAGRPTVAQKDLILHLNATQLKGQGWGAGLQMNNILRTNACCA